MKDYKDQKIGLSVERKNDTTWVDVIGNVIFILLVFFLIYLVFQTYVGIREHGLNGILNALWCGRRGC
jgi:hypothetical protein